MLCLATHAIGTSIIALHNMTIGMPGAGVGPCMVSTCLLVWVARCHHKGRHHKRPTLVCLERPMASVGVLTAMFIAPY